MAEGNVKWLEEQPKRDEESDRDAASRTAPNQVSTVLMQGVLTTPRPLCVEGDGVCNWRTWRQMWDAYATVSRIYEQSDEYQLATSDGGNYIFTATNRAGSGTATIMVIVPGIVFHSVRCELCSDSTLFLL